VPAFERSQKEGPAKRTEKKEACRRAKKEKISENVVHF
jgi:hypothetical protein